MPHELAAGRAGTLATWEAAGLRLAIVVAALIAVTAPAWREMIHQWWDIDTYSHILLIPPIIAWLVWLRRGELACLEPRPWLPGAVLSIAALAVWLGGTRLGINTIAQAGAVGCLQGAVLATLGLRSGLLLAFPLAYAVFLVPVGDEIIPPLQHLTAVVAVGLGRVSGIAILAEGIRIDTPAGLFVVAEECSGVKFLIAMLALGVLVCWSRFTSWRRRTLFLLACIVVPILANGVRAWATIFVAQYAGADAATGFDHIVYGWVFFAMVIALVLGLAWRWFERDPHDAGLRASDVLQLSWLSFLDTGRSSPAAVQVLLLGGALLFAVLARLG